MDLASFISRTRLTQRELGEQLNLSTGFIGQLATNRSKPAYDTILGLINLGMTPEELFGKDLGKKLRTNVLKENSYETQELTNISDDTVLDIVSRGLGLMLNRARG